MPKEDAIEVMGKVVEKFKAGMFSIELDAGRTVLATMAGRLRRKTHRNAYHVVTLLTQDRGGDAAVDATRHRDKHTRRAHRSASTWVARQAAIEPTSAARPAGAVLQAATAVRWAVRSAVRSWASVPGTVVVVAPATDVVVSPTAVVVVSPATVVVVSSDVAVVLLVAFFLLPPPQAATTRPTAATTAKPRHAPDFRVVRDAVFLGFRSGMPVLVIDPPDPVVAQRR